MTIITKFTGKDPLDKTKYIYKYADGTIITDKKIIEWIDDLRIPPMWKNVIINYNSSKSQTVCGYDDKNRQQCLYSEAHIKKARNQKYEDLIAFCESLPKIEAQINKNLLSTKFTKNKIIALILKIVLCCNFRLGTLTYEAQNESYGITTIRSEHLTFKKDGVYFDFIGKKGVQNECKISDPLLVKILYDLRNIKKADDHIMMYQIANEWFHIKHTDINNWLKEFGNSFTSKDFRTVRANLMIIDLLKDHDPNLLKPTERKKIMNSQIKEISEEIHNTLAVCRKDYIDSNILDLYLNHPVKYRKLFITPNITARIKFINWLKSEY